MKVERLKRAILLALADTELQKIMDATLYQSKSVSQIVQETNVSHSTAYRKIKWLVEEKMLIVDKVGITENRQKSSLFRTTLKSFDIKYEHNNLHIEAEQNFDIVRKIKENFFTLPDEGKVSNVDGVVIRGFLIKINPLYPVQNADLNIGINQGLGLEVKKDK